MKPLKTSLIVVALAAMLAASGSAVARGGHGGGHAYGHGGGHGGGHGYGYGHGHGHGYGRGVGIGLGFGLGVGALYYGPWGYAPYYYPPAVYAAPPVYVDPPVYIQREQAPPQAAPQQSNWFYCASKRTYYPYTPDCAEGWQQVTPQPPQAPR